MKTPVSDAAVHEYVDKIRNGVPTGNVFPCRMSDCEFTAGQRELIKEARVGLKAARKNGGGATATPIQKKQSAITIPPMPRGISNPEIKKPIIMPAILPEPGPNKGLTKLRRLLYLQSGQIGRAHV